MYYESYRKKPKKRAPRRRRPSFGQWLAQGLLKLLAVALAAALLCAALMFALPPATFIVEPENADLSLVDGLPSDCINILLLGTDVLRDNAQRSDSMIIASIGYGKLKLTSLLRDTYVEIPGHGKNRLNAAYAFGGPELAMKTINQNFSLNIMHYARVDFASLAALVDAIGGVDLALTEAERVQLNDITRHSGKVFAPLGYTPHEVLETGDSVHLDGLQALSYARIRKIDSDYKRASRQRILLNTMLKKVRDNLWNVPMLTRLTKTAFEFIDTNMSPVQMLSLGEKALMAGSAEQLRLPVDGTFTDNGSTLTITNPTANRDAFWRFVYGKE